MPTLDWIGKAAVVNHHQEVPYRLLHCDQDLSVGSSGEGNLLIQGDNLHALKALLPYYAGQIKCIYLDPPYNTGNKKGLQGWTYSDDVDSPEIRTWLGKVVGDEGEDLSRHDKWLCMMYPRLALARELLAEDGVIFISIDDNEVTNLRSLLDQIFLRKNWLACFVWQSEGNADNQGKIKIQHEYVLAYAKSWDLFPPPPIIDPNISDGSKLFNPLIQNTIVKNGPKNPISDIILPVGFPATFQEGVIPARNWTEPHFPYQWRESTLAGIAQLVKLASNCISNSVGGR